MNKEQKIDLLNNLVKRFNIIRNINSKIDEIFGSYPESELNTVIYGLFSDYVKSVSLLLKDDFGWVDWYIWENDCGNKHFPAKASKWAESKEINNINDLLDLIEVDNA